MYKYICVFGFTCEKHDFVLGFFDISLNPCLETHVSYIPDIQSFPSPSSILLLVVCLSYEQFTGELEDLLKCSMNSFLRFILHVSKDLHISLRHTVISILLPLSFIIFSLLKFKFLILSCLTDLYSPTDITSFSNRSFLVWISSF